MTNTRTPDGRVSAAATYAARGRRVAAILGAAAEQTPPLTSHDVLALSIAAEGLLLVPLARGGRAGPITEAEILAARSEAVAVHLREHRGVLVACGWVGDAVRPDDEEQVRRRFESWWSGVAEPALQFGSAAPSVAECAALATWRAEHDVPRLGAVRSVLAALLDVADVSGADLERSAGGLARACGARGADAADVRGTVALRMMEPGGGRAFSLTTAGGVILNTRGLRREAERAIGLKRRGGGLLRPETLDEVDDRPDVTDTDPAQRAEARELLALAARDDLDRRILESVRLGAGEGETARRLGVHRKTVGARMRKMRARIQRAGGAA